MVGKFSWISKDVHTELPRAYRDYADKLPLVTVAEDA